MSEPEILHVVPLAGDSIAAIVHPASGAWAYIDGERGRDLAARASGAAAPLLLSRGDPFFAETLEALDAPALQPSGAQPRAPLDTIILKITNRCNESCVHCYDARGEADADAETQSLKVVIDEALALCGPTLNILFHGGEPLLRMDLLEALSAHAVRRAGETGKLLGLFVQTNASILNDRIVGFLRDYDFGIGISLDGWAELHDRLRVMSNGAGTYRLFERSYSKHRDFLVRNAGILTTVTSLNAHLLPDIALFVRDLGFRSWEATLFDLMGRGSKFPELAPNADDYCDAMDRMLDLIEAGAFDSIAINPVLRQLDNLLTVERAHMCMPGAGPCGAGSRLLSVAADRRLSGCDILHDRALEFGSATAMTLQAALASPQAEQIRTRFDRLTHCHSCTWVGVCGGTCLARGSLTAPNTTDCRVSKRFNPMLMERLATGGKLLDWRRRFPSDRRRAALIWEDAEMRERAGRANGGSAAHERP